MFLSQVKNEAAVLGFVGAPFTLASYCVEGGSSKNFTMIKKLAFSEPMVLRRSLLHKLCSSGPVKMVVACRILNVMQLADSLHYFLHDIPII